jgi:hypothetical protein
MRLLITVLFALPLLGCAAAAASPRTPATVISVVQDSMPMLATADRVRLAEAFRLAAAVGDRIWTEWSRAPFAVLLVTPEHEFLLRHPRPSPDFRRIGYDSLLETTVFTRPRVFAPNLLATFPAVGGVPTVVIGQPANTGLTSTRWVLTVLHEHFHQLQFSQPGYYADVDALGLARGDTTGMWMLNFAFPYDSAAVQSRFAAFVGALDTAVDRSLAPSLASENGDAGRVASARAVATARDLLRAVLSADDDRYLAFQMWQEGVARYTELRLARLAAGPSFAPGDAFRALPDFTDYSTASAEIERTIRIGLRSADLAHDRRVAFYPIGAATALLLDAVAPAWRARYFRERFTLEPLRP